MVKPKRPDCVDADADSYTVKQLEEGLDCLNEYTQDLEAKNAALQRAIRIREAEVVRK